jgi:hypothetical protein
VNDTPPARGHSPLGMSALERRYCCPGSMKAEEGRPNTTSVYAQRGTDLHALAPACIKEGLNPLGALPEDPEGAEMILAYQIEVQSAHDRLGGELLLEQAFELSALSELYWGTADAVIIAPPTLYVADFKTGRGVAVPVRRDDGRVNLQLGGYGLGALHSLPTGLAHEITSIELCVVQPALGPPQRTVMTVAEVQDLAADLIEIAEAALDPSAPRIAGDHCRFCRAAGDCPALRERALSVAITEFNHVDDQGIVERLVSPPHLRPEELGRILEGADLVDEWIAAVRAHAKSLADKGEEIPGWKLVDKRGRRVWTDEEAATITMKGLLREDAFAHKLHSPTQIEKALKSHKLKKPPQWNTLVTLSDPGTTLVPASDPRVAVSPRIEFEIVNTEEQ